MTNHWHILRHIFERKYIYEKTLVIYWSGTGNTEAMANAVLEGKQGEQTAEAASEEAAADAE